MGPAIAGPLCDYQRDESATEQPRQYESCPGLDCHKCKQNFAQQRRYVCARTPRCSLLILPAEFAQFVILASTTGNLDRTNAIAQFQALREWPIPFNAEEQSAAKRVAAPRWINHGIGRDPVDARTGSVQPQVAARCSQRDDHAPQMRS